MVVLLCAPLLGGHWEGWAGSRFDRAVGSQNKLPQTLYNPKKQKKLMQGEQLLNTQIWSLTYGRFAACQPV